MLLWLPELPPVRGGRASANEGVSKVTNSRALANIEMELIYATVRFDQRCAKVAQLIALESNFYRGNDGRFEMPGAAFCLANRSVGEWH